MDPDLEQLLMLKDLTAKTGVLHEAQCLQLRYWPLVLTHATKANVYYSYKDKEVIFDLIETTGKPHKDLAKRLKLLAKFTKELLGDEYSVAVELKGKRLNSFKGKPNGKEKGSSNRKASRKRKG